MKEYVIDTISKETLEKYGYDSSHVSDETMKKIAELLRNTFRECMLDNLPQIAEGLNIPISSNPHYTASRVYVSLNDEEGNCHETNIFHRKEDAFVQLECWRNEELQLRKKTGCYYNVIVDAKDRFRMSWDDDKEMLSIGIC